MPTELVARSPEPGLLVGLGLMGGSLAWDLRQEGIPRWWGSDPCMASMQGAQAQGCIQGPWHPGAVCSVVVFATPVGCLESALRHHRDAIGPNTLVMDLCSVKQPVAAVFDRLLPDHPGVVPCHPMAGTQHAGWTSAQPGLFKDQVVFLCPRPVTAPWALEQALTFWTDRGACPHVMEAEAHDQTVAMLSHLPHLVSMTYLALVQDLNLPTQLAGPGFRDFSRIGHSPAALWQELFFQNRCALAPPLTALIHRLQRHLEALTSA